MMLDKYADPQDFTAGMRPDDIELYHGTNEEGEKVGFITAIHRDAHKPFRQKMIYSRKVEPLSSEEKLGPKWGGK